MINEELREKERIIAQLEKRILELEDATIIKKTNFRVNELEQRIKEIEKFVKTYRCVADDVYEQNISVEKNLERNNAKFDKLNELVMTKVKTKDS
jgi:TolA-binding protein